MSHRDREVETWRREEDGGWSRRAFGAGAQVPLASLGCTLAVDAIYHDPLAG